MDNLKQKALRSGLVKIVGQGINFALKIGFVIALSRLLDPADFGLVAMVTAVTGVYQLFVTAGLSTASIQKENITEEELTALFWINILVGIVLFLACLLSAPILASFYNDPRLLSITAASSVTFLFSAAGVQHIALLQRQLRYPTLVAIETTGQVVSIAAAIGLGLAGFAYWALVASVVVYAAVNTIGAWLVTGWIPGAPRRSTNVRAMLHVGGTVTLNSLIVYVAYNLDKVLLGRFWGAAALGIYSRAYYLIDIPTANINTAIGGVLFSALSRLQHDRERLTSYFLKSYSLITSLTLPITLLCAIYADEIVRVAMGDKWDGAAIIFRLMAPTILVFGMINPLYWLLLALGLQMRSLYIALFIAPYAIAAYLIGLPYGPEGVALSFSIAMSLFLVPCLAWSFHGTGVTARMLWRAIYPPLLSALGAGLVAQVVHTATAGTTHAFFLLLLGGVTMFGVHFVLLLFVLKQRHFYLELLTGIVGAERLSWLLRRATPPPPAAP